MRYSDKRGSSDTDNVKLIAALIVLIIYGIYKLCVWIGNNYGGNYFRNAFLLVLHSYWFWGLFLVCAAYSVVMHKRNPKRFLLCELCTELAVLFVGSLIFYGLILGSAKLQSFEIQNGAATKAIMYEAYVSATEVCDSTDSNGDCTSSHDEYTSHDPEWKLETEVGFETITEAQYHNFETLWNNRRYESVFRPFERVVSGGGSYVVTYDRSRGECLVPASRRFAILDYRLDAVGTDLLEATAEKARPYPSIENGAYGSIHFPRVVIDNASIPDSWRTTLQTELDRRLAFAGPSREVNVVVYIAGGNRSRGFARVVKDTWRDGRKNDVTVVIGMSDFPIVSWAEVYSLARDPEFNHELGKLIEAKKEVANAGALADTIIHQINLPPVSHGFERTPMSEFVHLARGIRPPAWLLILYVMVVGGACLGLVYWCEENNIYEYDPSSWRRR